MTTEEKIEIMQAYVDGKQIQQIQVRWYNETIEWEDAPEPSWNWEEREYRIKPEPKEPTYRPYKNAKEFLDAQKEHGYYIFVSEDTYRSPILVLDDGVVVCTKCYEHYTFSYDDLILYGTKFQDGTPCGVKEE